MQEQRPARAAQIWGGSPGSEQERRAGLKPGLYKADAAEARKQWRGQRGDVTRVAKLGRSMLRPYKEEERFITAHADAFAGTNAEEKSACSVRNDGGGGGAEGNGELPETGALQNAGRVRLPG